MQTLISMWKGTFQGGGLSSSTLNHRCAVRPPANDLLRLGFLETKAGPNHNELHYARLGGRSQWLMVKRKCVLKQQPAAA